MKICASIAPPSQSPKTLSNQKEHNKLKLQLEKAVLGLKLRIAPKGLEPILANEHISKTGVINSLYAIQKIDRDKLSFRCPYVLIKIKNDELQFTELNDIQAMFYFDHFGKSYPLKK
ncbi:hypothetical protein HX024_18205 [Myroides marinus]|uniref:hypothetical protein n=1 Tax=Myroides marinus TaxID=703342 RepID=UPI0025787868|nr:MULTISPECIES: hypothetical protein [Bacteria]MDM1384595.1 hypothetical protein [Myroides marinus]MDM1487710.1 hypothetical protein [Acinetobacter towneri]